MEPLNGNYIDLIIILVLAYYIWESFRHGFWIVVADFVAFFGSLVLSLRFYKYIADFLKVQFSLNLSVSNAVGFLIAAIVFESLLGYILGHLIHKLPDKFKKHKINKFLGILPGIGEGLVITAFLLTLSMALPVRPQIKNDIMESKIGGMILEKTTIFEKSINEVFGGVINESLTYFTVNPNSSESVNLEVQSFNLSVDEVAETEMFKKVNEERRKLAIEELIWDPTLVPVGRAHAKDMWERKYFSHYSPEGEDVGDRLKKANIDYSFAGENLALAPTTKSAHTGLMNSEGHRQNILEPRFKRVGIGVIDNGVYGKMYVQVFKN
jgi:uncharacterized protein YkwD